MLFHAYVTNPGLASICSERMVRRLICKGGRTPYELVGRRLGKGLLDAIGISTVDRKRVSLAQLV